MSSLDLIKQKVGDLYRNNPKIHINVCISRPRTYLKNVSAVIKGVYPHMFRIEECSSGFPKYHTLQYVDILTEQVEIVELKK